MADGGVLSSAVKGSADMKGSWPRCVTCWMCHTALHGCDARNDAEVAAKSFRAIALRRCPFAVLSSENIKV
eukprot:CAMPEP_0180679044 /NCGR_PEP_ID=MMETSP1037_2-20121125/68713_1 /TAXON_ID=632150 /ORGANISM="Azadinium spinosum, Strain 3D9" /LENGTH=70 /DNA_ID=CAMNT_0022708743 /DNA_START=1 /DNA_END=213 /DNA_ORIENTATION=+